jgi:hypothetical protein
VADPDIVVLEVPTPPIVVEVEISDTPDVVEISVQGPVGPRGLPGETSEDLTLVASQPVSGHRVLAWDGGEVRHADPSSLTDGWLVVGVSTHAAVAGDLVHVQKSGLLSDSSISLTASAPVFLGADGALTSTPPSLVGGAVFSMRVGTALETNTINIAIGIPIAL